MRRVPYMSRRATVGRGPRGAVKSVERALDFGMVPCTTRMRSRPRLVDCRGVHEVAQGAGRAGVERPAGGQDEVAARRRRIEARLVPGRDRGVGDAEALDAAIGAGDLDQVSGCHVAQEREVRVAVGGIWRDWLRLWHGNHFL